MIAGAVDAVDTQFLKEKEKSQQLREVRKGDLQEEELNQCRIYLSSLKLY